MRPRISTLMTLALLFVRWTLAMIVAIFVVVAVMQLPYKGVGSWAAGEAMASPLLSLEHLMALESDMKIRI